MPGACPKEISIDYIALMNRDYIKAKFKTANSPPNADPTEIQCIATHFCVAMHWICWRGG